MGASNSPIEKIRRVRNFIAHRSEDTAQKVRALSFYHKPMRVEVFQIAGQTVPPGATTMEIWIAGLRLAASAAIQ